MNGLVGRLPAPEPEPFPEPPAAGPARLDLDEQARRLVATWPPLTPEQRARLIDLLSPTAQPPGRAGEAA